MTKDELRQLAKAEATKQCLDPALVCAICEQESSWDPYAMRFEPVFYQRYVAPKFPKGQCTESVNQATSFGLMQIMGLCAREIGWTAPLGALMEPAANLKYGCKLLSLKLVQASHDVSHALLLWNGGGNKKYPGQVLARRSQYEA